MDPRAVGPKAKSANHSNLMSALMRRSLGEPVNFCPFGCASADLTEGGYCRHLVGFSNDGKIMEVLKRDRMGQYFVDGTENKPVLSSDILERITTSFRVYREKVAKEHPKESSNG